MNRKAMGAITVLIGLTFQAPQAIAQDRDKAAGSVSPAEIAELKTQLAEQQKQIGQLRAMLEEQKKLLETRTADRVEPRNLGQVASTTPIVPLGPPPVLPAIPAAMPAAAAAAPQQSVADAAGPLQLRLGNAFISPVGFMDMTSVTRSTNPGSGIGTNFGSIPYSNTQAGSLSETRLSPQNSRVGMRIDTGIHGYNVMGYWESDFLGQTGAPPNGGLAVSSNPYVFRLRLYWVNVSKGKFDILAGQSWSMMVPNRKGISPLPGDLFYSQDIDVNYQLGLVWGRIPGFRAVYHPSDKVAFGVALENSEPYVGGGNGGSAIVGPAAIYGTPNAVSGAVLGGQINNGNSVISAAALHPDIIAKLAFDPSSKFHFEIAGVEITDKISNPVSTPAFQTHTKAGGGGSVNLSFELVKGFRILTNNYWSSGGGRYIFGQAPDFMIRADGSLSLIRSGSTVTGFEATAGNTLFYGYYGGVYIARNLALDANGKTLIGYGGISSDGQNRAIQEVSFGTNTTLLKDAKWGALNLMFQYSYLQRNPWYAAVGAPSNASLSMGFVNLRYTLPGAPAPKVDYK
jgi:hypothetical protein